MRRLPLYERLRVRTPCDEEWDEMEQRGSARHCARCDHLVHDVASLTRAEAEHLVAARENGERICLNIHVRRSDDAILLADGHVEREPSRRAPPSRMLAVAVAAATAMTACSSKETATRETPIVVAATASAAAVPAPAPIAPAPEPPPVETLSPPTMPAPSPPTSPNHAGTVAANTPKKHYRMLKGI